MDQYKNLINKKIIFILIAFSIVTAFMLYDLAAENIKYDDCITISDYSEIPDQLENPSYISKIAILDSGLSDSLLSLYSNKIVDVYNAIDDSNYIEDLYGHGSSVFCVISCTYELNGVNGVSTNSEIYIVKVINDFGNIKPEYIIKGLKYAFENDVDIINLSFGSYEYNAEIANYIKMLCESGIKIVSPLYILDDGSMSFPGSLDCVYSVIESNLDSSTNNVFIGNVANVFSVGIKTINIHTNTNVISSGSSLSTAILSGYLSNKKMEEKNE